jgi:hypothetical protein
VAVPKTPMDKDDFPSIGKHDIGTTGKILAVKSETIT